MEVLMEVWWEVEEMTMLPKMFMKKNGTVMTPILQLEGKTGFLAEQIWTTMEERMQRLVLEMMEDVILGVKVGLELGIP